ncbi:hypothetical protein MJO55_28835 (plasmid) [Mycolicibacterium rufum]|uniref:Uncharacterized protein n=1 Tax=Mycolicibacterium rufum TaxID=318424 RepID=A0A9X2YEI6_9MYCO|nr:hypothetical protein [Mycolicibacterium rufum]MCV7072004.1 hypothetical protein [Mycolicibacterium rufum]ULP39924.1 hypothetical protein MJO55_28835 [Mycolicibacterium rufum]
MPIGLLSNSDVWSDRHKAVALYFDQMALAVPAVWDENRIYQRQTAVRELADRQMLSVLKYRVEDHANAAAPIIEAVHRWPEEIRAAIEIVQWRPRTGLRATLDEHWFSEDLAGCLVDANLGYLKYETEPPFDPFLRTSARIAQIYNSRLAEIVASRLGFSLTGVDHGPFPGSAHWGPETVREVLTTGTFVGDVQLHESTGVAGLALVSIQAVLPGDLKAMTIRQVADFRARNRLALTTFQDFIERIVTSSALPEVLSSPSDARAVVLQLQNEYERSVAPALRSLERSLQKIGVGAVWRALSLNTAAPLLVAGGLNSILPDGALSQVIVSSAGLALAAGRLVYDARSERTEQALANPVGYLLALQREDWRDGFHRHQISGPLVDPS